MSQTGGNRGPWIIAGAILVAAVLVVGVMVYFRAQDQERRCDELEAQMVTPDSTESMLRAANEIRLLDC